MLLLNPSKEREYLNTSNVKVQPSFIKYPLFLKTNLNTSNVKVQRYCVIERH